MKRRRMNIGKLNVEIGNLQLGFTMVELTVIMAVLGVLITGVIVIINPLAQIEKAQDARRKSDLNQIQRALDLYYEDNGGYPPAGAGFTINNVSWGSSWTPYMGTLPKDPTSPTKTYIYNASADGQAYWLYANVARGAQDPQACAGGDDCPNVPGAQLCGGGSACNFGVSSPNVSP